MREKGDALEGISAISDFLPFIKASTRLKPCRDTICDNRNPHLGVQGEEKKMIICILCHRPVNHDDVATVTYPDGVKFIGHGHCFGSGDPDYPNEFLDKLRQIKEEFFPSPEQLAQRVREREAQVFWREKFSQAEAKKRSPLRRRWGARLTCRTQ